MGSLEPPRKAGFIDWSLNNSNSITQKCTKTYVKFSKTSDKNPPKILNKKCGPCIMCAKGVAPPPGLGLWHRSPSEVDRGVVPWSGVHWRQPFSLHKGLCITMHKTVLHTGHLLGKVVARYIKSDDCELAIVCLQCLFIKIPRRNPRTSHRHSALSTSRLAQAQGRELVFGPQVHASL